MNISVPLVIVLLRSKYALMGPSSPTGRLKVRMCQESIALSFTSHPKVSTLLAVQVNSTVVFEQTALPDNTSIGLVRLRATLGVPACKQRQLVAMSLYYIARIYNITLRTSKGS